MKPLFRIPPENFIPEVLGKFVACHWGADLKDIPQPLRESLEYLLEDCWRACEKPGVVFHQDDKPDETNFIDNISI